MLEPGNPNRSKLYVRTPPLPWNTRTLQRPYRKAYEELRSVFFWPQQTKRNYTGKHGRLPGSDSASRHVDRRRGRPRQTHQVREVVVEQNVKVFPSATEVALAPAVTDVRCYPLIHCLCSTSSSPFVRSNNFQGGPILEGGEGGGGLCFVCHLA